MLRNILILLIVIILVTFAYTNIIKPQVQTNINNVIFAPPNSTPFPFQELTIPFLRNREYKSTLREIKKYADYPNYTSYLTSYDSDGLKINALITKPKGEAPSGGFPAIVFVHGYIAPSVYKTTEKYIDYVNYLAKNGFVVLKIDLRGHGESEGVPTGSYYSGDYVIDTLNAYSALQNSDFVNPNKIGLWGHSMAGNIVLRSFVVKQNIPAINIWGGAGYTYSDLLAYGLNDNSYRPPNQNSNLQSRRKLLNDTYGTFNPENEFWKQVPATNYLNGISGAIELHHANDDTTVNVEYSRNLIKVLSNSNIPHELFVYNSGGHNISGSSFSTAMQRTVEFYKRYLSE